MSAIADGFVKNLAVASFLILLPTLIGCGVLTQADGPGRILSTAEARQLLLRLPYKYKFRPVKLPKGASGALAGRAVGKHRTFINFGIALGREPYGVPVPPTGTSNAYGYPYGGFVYTDDLQVRGKHGGWHRQARFKTLAQWHEVIRMIVEIQEQLCKASTGRPCPP